MTDNNIPCGVCEYDPTLKILGSWLLELPMAALSRNALKSNVPGRYGHKYRKYRDDAMEFIEANSKHIPKANGAKRRVFFTRYYASPARSFDKDNRAACFKPLQDCLTKLGLIVDDRDKYLQAHYRQVKADSNYMTIEIEDIAW